MGSEEVEALQLSIVAEMKGDINSIRAALEKNWVMDSWERIWNKSKTLGFLTMVAALQILAGLIAGLTGFELNVMEILQEIYQMKCDAGELVGPMLPGN